MSKTDKTDKIDSNSLENEIGEITDTSFITNIKIDVSASPDKGLSKERKTPENAAFPKERSFTSNANLGASKSSGRTTTLALDPRPYKKRERVYTTIIIILSIALVAQSALLWAMQLHHNSRQNNNLNKSQTEFIISGVNLNQDKLKDVTDAVMRKHLGVSLVILPKNERVALAEFAQGKIQIIQTTEPLSAEEKKELDLIIGKPVQEIHIQLSALGIYTSDLNPISELTLEQLKMIYLGEISSWKSLGNEDSPITTYKLEDNQFIDKIFQEKVMKYSSPKISFNKPLGAFSQMPQAIGYGEVKSLLPNKTKLIKLKLTDSEQGITPIIGNKVNEKYPLVYSTYWYIAGLPDRVLQSFVEEIKK